jgi:hypothetical protein
VPKKKQQRTRNPKSEAKMRSKRAAKASRYEDLEKEIRETQDMAAAAFQKSQEAFQQKNRN